MDSTLCEILFETRVTPILQSENSPTNKCERVNQFFSLVQGNLCPAKENRLNRLVKTGSIRGTLCYIGPTGPCQGPSGEEKNFQIGGEF